MADVTIFFGQDDDGFPAVVVHPGTIEISTKKKVTISWRNQLLVPIAITFPADVKESGKRKTTALIVDAGDEESVTFEKQKTASSGIDYEIFVADRVVVSKVPPSKTQRKGDAVNPYGRFKIRRAKGSDPEIIIN